MNIVHTPHIYVTITSLVSLAAELGDSVPRALQLHRQPDVFVAALRRNEGGEGLHRVHQAYGSVLISAEEIRDSKILKKKLNTFSMLSCLRRTEHTK